MKFTSWPGQSSIEIVRVHDSWHTLTFNQDARIPMLFQLYPRSPRSAAAAWTGPTGLDGRWLVLLLLAFNPPTKVTAARPSVPRFALPDQQGPATA